jgi:chromosome segregation ATPase
MDRNELKRDIEQVVAAIFSEKEEADIRRMTEEALETSAKTITELTTSLEERNAELAEFEEKISESESKVSNLETELEAAQTEIETYKGKLSESEKALEELKKDRASEIRMAELVKAGVATSNTKAQSAKVREMSDEDFAAYRDELLELRAAVETELKNNAEAEEAEEKVEEKEEEEAAEEEVAEEEEVVPPVNINPAHAAMASMNMEIIPNADLISKYAELGQAMAAVYKKNN